MRRAGFLKEGGARAGGISNSTSSGNQNVSSFQDVLEETMQGTHESTDTNMHEQMQSTSTPKGSFLKPLACPKETAPD